MAYARLRSLLAAAALALGAFVAPASAADIPGVQTWAAPNRVAASWQGFYVGGHLGYTFGRYDGTLTPGPSVFTIDGSSFSGGLFAGMNFQIAPQFVAGVEADFALFNPTGSALIAGSRYTADSNWLATARGRIGFTVDNFLIYATAGVAMADLTYGGPAGSSSRTAFGWTIGAGVEARITENFFARAEYLYAAFGNDDHLIGAGQAIRGDFDSHQVRIGAGFRF